MSLWISGSPSGDNPTRYVRLEAAVPRACRQPGPSCDTNRMTNSTHSQTCQCSLHVELLARRHECYRQLAQSILGPAAPQEDLALARALANHAKLNDNVTEIRRRRAA